MTDLRLSFDPQFGAFDLSIGDEDFAAADGLETAVVLSLFCDARVDGAGLAPFDRRGWWGDLSPPLVAGRVADGDRFGSRLWALAGARQVPETAERARQYAREALAWMIDDGVAASVEAEASFPAPGVLFIEVTIQRPDGERLPYRWQLAWQTVGGGDA